MVINKDLRRILTPREKKKKNPHTAFFFVFSFLFVTEDGFCLSISNSVTSLIMLQQGFGAGELEGEKWRWRKE